MILLVRIDTDPPLSFYRDARALPFAAGSTYRRLADVGTIRRPLQVGGGEENANCSFTLDNGDGSLTGVFADPPFKRRATLEDITTGTAVKLFTGVVTRVALGPVITIDLEA